MILLRIFVSTDVAECSLPVDVCGQGDCIERTGDYYCSCSPEFAGENCDKSKLHIIFMQPVLQQRRICVAS